MVQIVIGLLLWGAALVLQSNANLSAQYTFERHPEYVVFGGLMLIGAVLFFLVGLKQYFLKEIIDELKKLSASKG